MAMVNLQWFLFALLVVAAKCTADKAYFTAAVYEHKPVAVRKNVSQFQIIEDNVIVYLEKIGTAARQGAQIIVCPEYGLIDDLILDRPNLQKVLPEVVDPKIVKNWNPCTDLQYTAVNSPLIQLSCSARYNNIYVAFNHGTRVPCSSSDVNCPSDKAYLYNTDIVFDSNGTLVARYHKKHLFLEDFYDSPKNFDFRTFQTSFGKFGLFICYDMLFSEVTELIKKYQVDSIIFSSEWVDSYPLFLAVQAQSGFAINHEVNLLGSNMHVPQHGSVGSGIYAGKYGAVNYTMSTSPYSKLLISKVPIKPKSDVYRPSSFLNNETVSPEKHQVLTMTRGISRGAAILKNSSGSLSVSNNNITCHLEYEIDRINFFGKYYLQAFDSVIYGLPQRSLAFKLCILINADNSPSAKQSIFKRVKLSGNFQPSVLNGMFPSVITNYLKLAPTDQWTYSNGTISSPKGISEPLQMITLTVRDFANDP